MEPIQKVQLETVYTSLHMAGYTAKGDKTRKKLMGSFIGIYAGANTGELMYIPHESAGGFAGSEGSPAIIANRVSFVLGLMGPSYTIQADNASALLAVVEGAWDILPSNYLNKPSVECSVCTGTYLGLTPFWWPLYSAYMNPIGRTFTFDHDANGFIKADGASALTLKRHGEIVDGKFTVDDEVHVFGTLSGWSVNQNGSTSALSAPNGIAQQMCVLDCIRQANVTPLDIDFVTCHGEGRVLHDAVEVSALAKVLRDGKLGNQIWGLEVLPLTTASCRMGFSQEAQGLSALWMTLACQRHGCVAPNVHAKVLNHHISELDGPVNISTEPSPLRTRTTFAGVSAYGFSGTNAHVQMKTDIDSEKSPLPKVYLAGNFFSYWPGGGGQIQYNAEPVKNYTILGSWSSWQDLESMQDEGQGVHGFTVVLGENRFEQFQLLLDGDRSRTLHPGQPMASHGSSVLGPDLWSEVETYNWLLDGRPALAQQPSYHIDALASPQSCQDANPFAGAPGDVYRIRIQVAGKWRTVVWSKVVDESGASVRKAVPRGSYFLSGNWDNWALNEMELVDAEKGLYALEVCVLTPGECHFQVVRNMDPCQVFYPQFEEVVKTRSSMVTQDKVVGGRHAPILGPDDMHW